MALTCNNQNQIGVSEIINAININEANITTNASDIVTVATEASGNSTSITDHETRIAAIETSSSPSGGDFDSLYVRVATNESDIVSLNSTTTQQTTDISFNASSISSAEANISQNQTDILSNQNEIILSNTSISQNISDIAALDARTVSLENDSAKYAILVHQTAPAVDGGSAAVNTWTQRNIQTVIHDTIGGTSGQTSYTLPVGEYKVTVFGVANSLFHQTRVNIDGIGSTGSTVSGQSQSISVDRVVVASNSIISVETMVSAINAGKELGEANPFGENNIYVTLTIEKVG